MSQLLLKSRLLFAYVASSIILFPLSSYSQVIPDKSLNTNINIINNPKSKVKKRIVVTGGKRIRGVTFHSFSDFNINKNQEVVFNVNPRVKHIITRVIRNKSIINGKLKSKGKSDIILANPNGIRFGKNFIVEAGSFIPTTASSFTWGDSGLFSTINKKFNSEAIGDIITLNFTPNNSNISIIGSLENFKSFQLIGTVPYPKFKVNKPLGFTSENGHLAVLSNQILTNQASINSVNHDVYLYAVNKGTIEYNFNKKRLNTLSISKYGNIDLNNNSHVNIFSRKTNSLYIKGENISIRRGSILAHYGNENSLVKNNQSLNIESDKLILTGPNKNPKLNSLFNTPSQIISFASKGVGASINISNKNSILTGGSQIYSVARNKALGGNLDIASSKSISVSGFLDVGENLDLTFNPVYGLATGAFDRGRSGSVNITSPSISIRDSAQIGIFTADNAFSNDINISSERLLVSGRSPLLPLSSNIQTAHNTPNPAGDVVITSKKIILEGGAGIGSASISQGDTGIVQINANSLVLEGNSELKGIENDQVPETRIFSSVNNQAAEIIDIVGDLDLQANSKNIAINVKNLSMNGGEITVDNDGIGNGGNILINSQNINLFKGSRIIATTKGGNGGLIKLVSPQISIEGSTISSSSKGDGIGGNLSLKSKVLRVDNESKILADSENSRAGNIKIDTNIFLNRNAIISASSNLGTFSNGEISITHRNPEVKSASNLPQLNKLPITISSKCTTTSKNSSIEEHGIGNISEMLSERQKKALNLKRRVEYAKQFYYIDSETGKKKPFKPLLGIEKNEEGKLELLFSTEQSKGLQNLLSSLDNTCSVKT